MRAFDSSDGAARGLVSRDGSRPMIRVSHLATYPLKGGRGIPVGSLRLDRFGPAGDRRWMAVDPDGRAITQREASRLCLVQARPTDGGLELAAPGMAPLFVELIGPTAAELMVRIWRDRCPAADQGEAAARWLSDVLARPCRLVHMPDTTFRPIDPAYDPGQGRVSFADGFPLLLANDASLGDLNARLATPLPMNRFRPNLVVAGAGPFEEDGWRRIRIGAVRFELVKPCARCRVTTVDQATGAAGREPLATLARFRARDGEVLFGMNLVHRDQGTIAVGDEVVVEVGGPALAR